MTSILTLCDMIIRHQHMPDYKAIPRVKVLLNQHLRDLKEGDPGLAYLVEVAVGRLDAYERAYSGRGRA